jgi:hypothetical protein
MVSSIKRCPEIITVSLINGDQKPTDHFGFWSPRNCVCLFNISDLQYTKYIQMYHCILAEDEKNLWAGTNRRSFKEEGFALIKPRIDKNKNECKYVSMRSMF